MSGYRTPQPPLYDLFPDESGRTGNGFEFKDGIKEHAKHPDLGVPLAGVLIQGFREVQDLALEASRKFALAGFLGLDIALTDITSGCTREQTTI